MYKKRDCGNNLRQRFNERAVQDRKTSGKGAKVYALSVRTSRQ